METDGAVASPKTPIFGIFEGGGARGIAHIGAYAAAEEMNLEFVGVAGASAGSVVAALIAVGYSPAEIFDPDDPSRNVFARHDLSPLEALGTGNWRRLKRLRRYGRGALALALVLLACALGASLLGASLDRARVLSGVAIVCTTLVSGWFWSMVRKRGILDPVKFAEVFNRVLRSRVMALYAEAGKPTDRLPDKIRFRDIDVQQLGRFCRLKVVVTDISGQQLRLFDHRTPDVVIAEAVAASVAIPGIFKPAFIPSVDVPGKGAAPTYYADGGLVSNLPVWCFAEEKAAAERRRPHSAAVPIVAFSLAGARDGSSGAGLPPLAYVAQVLRTAIFGGQIVVQDFVNDLCAVQLPCALDVLEFEVGWERARAAHDVAKQHALERLRRRLILEPEAWAAVLAAACADITSAIESRRAVRGEATPLRLRAAVFEPIRSVRNHPAAEFITAYRVTHSLNMEEDADDRLTLDADSPGVPEAFEQRDLILWGPRNPTRRIAKMTKYERALVRGSVKSAICIPVFSDVEQWNSEIHERNQPLAVASFDTDQDIIGLLNDDGVLCTVVTEATFGISSWLRESAG